MEKTTSKNNRKTVGAKSLELSSKVPDKVSAVEQMRESWTGFDENIQECIKTNIREFGCDFYVVVITKKERLMKNVLRNYFFGRKSCPTPDYDQVVYKYSINSGNLQFMWVIPSKDTCTILLENAHIVDPKEYQLLGFVKQFAEGTLLGLSKQLNNERADSNIIES